MGSARRFGGHPHLPLGLVADLPGVRTRAALVVPALLVLAVLVACASFGCGAQVHKTSALRRVQTIRLPGVEGRIDHLAVDLTDERLFVAALENNTLEVVDLKSGKRIDQIEGLQEPQGVAYVSATHELIVTNGGGGTADIFDARSLARHPRVDLGPDPDNVRYDPATERAYVGYGEGLGAALAMLDLKTGTKIADIQLSGHPESFQLEKDGERIFVNVPDFGEIVVVDREKGTVVATWPIKGASENFPMALDEADHRLFVGTRSPPKLLVLDTDTGRMLASLDSPGDADDIFYDAEAQRIYISGGAGSIDVFEQKDANHYKSLGEVSTAEGARTSLFVPETRRLYLAVPNYGAQQAEVRVYEAVHSR
jgi:DNA-binding beta-propeller fold protein YncE